MAIYNCHTHTFTTQHVPDRFLGPLTPILKSQTVLNVLGFIGRRVFFLSDTDLLDRYVRFLKIGNVETQREVFSPLKEAYPTSSPIRRTIGGHSNSTKT